MKICKNCGLEHDKRNCPACQKIRYDKWRAENPDKARAASNAWKKVNSERNKEITRNWIEENREHVNEYSRLRYRNLSDEEKGERNKQALDRLDNRPGARTQYSRNWRKKHPERAKELVMRRNAQKRELAQGSVDYEYILERDGLWCYLCQSDILEESFHFDHVVPLSKGGMHSEENIRPTHALCNMRKGAKLIEELEWILKT